MKNPLVALFIITLAVAASAITSETVSPGTASHEVALATSQEVSVEATNVEVLGGPLRVVDFPLVFPNPFSPSRHNEIIIQYTLSEDTDIDLQELFEQIRSGAQGKIVEVIDDESGEHVEIFVE